MAHRRGHATKKTSTGRQSAAPACRPCGSPGGQWEAPRTRRHQQRAPSRTLKTFVRAATNNSNEVLQSALRVVRVVQMEKWQLERLSLGTPAQRENLVPSSPSQKLQPNDPASSSTARSAASCCSGSSSGDAVAGLSVSRRRLRALSVCTRVEPRVSDFGALSSPYFFLAVSVCKWGICARGAVETLALWGPMGYTSLRRLFGQKMGGKKKGRQPTATHEARHPCSDEAALPTSTPMRGGQLVAAEFPVSPQ